MLEIKNLSVCYPGHASDIIKNQSFTVSNGKALWLQGPNGAGKTTLLYAIANIIPQEITAERSGDILLDGTPTAECKINQLCPDLTISLANPCWELFFGKPAEEIIFVLENIGLSPSDIQSRLDSAIRQFNLQMIQDTESHKLSLGCQKMLSLAIQAAIKPKVLLLDEALNGLSESNRVIVINWLQDYLNEGGSLVIADHDRIISELRPSILKLD